MLLLPVDNVAEDLSWDITLLVGICQAMKLDLGAALAVERKQTGDHPSVIFREKWDVKQESVMSHRLEICTVGSFILVCGTQP